MANHKKKKRRQKKINKTLMSKKLRKQRNKSDAKSDSIFAAHRGYGSGKAK